MKWKCKALWTLQFNFIREGEKERNYKLISNASAAADDDRVVDEIIKGSNVGHPQLMFIH